MPTPREISKTYNAIHLNDVNSQMRSNFKKGWTKRRNKFGLNLTDPLTGRFIKHGNK